VLEVPVAFVHHSGLQPGKSHHQLARFRSEQGVIRYVSIKDGVLASILGRGVRGRLARRWLMIRRQQHALMPSTLPAYHDVWRCETGHAPFLILRRTLHEPGHSNFVFQPVSQPCPENVNILLQRYCIHWPVPLPAFAEYAAHRQDQVLRQKRYLPRPPFHEFHGTTGENASLLLLKQEVSRLNFAVQTRRGSVNVARPIPAFVRVHWELYMSVATSAQHRALACIFTPGKRNICNFRY